MLHVIDTMYCHTPVHILMTYGLFVTIRSLDNYLSESYCSSCYVLSHAIRSRRPECCYLTLTCHPISIHFVTLHSLTLSYMPFQRSYSVELNSYRPVIRVIHTHTHTHTVLPTQVFTHLFILILHLLIEAWIPV